MGALARNWFNSFMTEVPTPIGKMKHKNNKKDFPKSSQNLKYINPRLTSKIQPETNHNWGKQNTD